MKGPTSRQVAVHALTEIDGGSRANVVLAALLEDQGKGLSQRDRAFVTELVQGTTRMRRALDHLFKPFVSRNLDRDVSAALRLGAYQLFYLQTPPHAAVNDTVEAAPRRARGLVNAVLRKVVDVIDALPCTVVRVLCKHCCGFLLLCRGNCQHPRTWILFEFDALRRHS